MGWTIVFGARVRQARCSLRDQLTWHRCYSIGGVLSVAFVGIVGGTGQALAVSAGCAAANTGTLNLFIPASSTNGAATGYTAGFASGDILTITIARSASEITNVDLRKSPGDGVVLNNNSANTTTVLTYTVLGGAVNDLSLRMVGTSQFAATATTTITVTCSTAASGGTNTSTNTQKVSAVQSTGSRISSQASGAAISGAIGGAIADGLSGANGAPPAAAIGLGAQPSNLGAGSEQMSRLGAIAAPSVAGASDRGLPTVVSNGWKPWASISASGWDQDDRGSSARGLKGNQVNGTFGVGRLIASGVLVGVVGGYENFSYDFSSLNGRLKGDGWTVGSYLGMALTNTLRFDVAGTWTGLTYDAMAGAAAGSFNASRWLISSGLTGSYRVNALLIEPSTRLFTLRERQEAWTDSLGGAQASRGFSVGRSSTGAKLSYPLQFSAGTTLTPYVGMYGDYRFSSDGSPPVNVPTFGLRNDWSARATLGIVMSLDGGTRLSLDGEYSGLGSSDLSAWTIGGRGAIPF